MKFDWTMERITKLLFRSTLELGNHSDRWVEDEYESEKGCSFAEAIRGVLLVDDNTPTEAEVGDKIIQMWPAIMSLRDELLKSRNDVVDFYGVATIMKRLTVSQREELEGLYSELGHEVEEAKEAATEEDQDEWICPECGETTGIINVSTYGPSYKNVPICTTCARKGKEEPTPEDTYDQKLLLNVKSLGDIHFGRNTLLRSKDVMRFTAGFPFSTAGDELLSVLAVGGVTFRGSVDLYPGEICSLLDPDFEPPPRTYFCSFDVDSIEGEVYPGVQFHSAELTLAEIRTILFGS